MLRTEVHGTVVEETPNERFILLSLPPPTTPKTTSLPNSLTYLSPPTESFLGCQGWHPSVAARNLACRLLLSIVWGAAMVHTVLSTVHTQNLHHSVGQFGSSFQNCIFLFKNTLYFLPASEIPRIESLTHQILEPHHSPGLWFLIQGVTTENQHTVSWECPGLAVKLPALISLSSSQCSRVLKHRN